MVTLFSKSKRKGTSPLQLADDSLYSVTPWKEANCIAKAIFNQLKILTLDSRLVITDIGANVGGNTIGFWTQGFCSVNSIEISATTAAKLKHNLSQYLLPRSRVFVENWDYVLTLNQHAVFMDPPWEGGVNYLDHDQSKLGFDGQSLTQIIDQIFQHTDALLVAVKVPKNYDLTRLSGYHCLLYPFYRTHEDSDTLTRQLVYYIVLIVSTCDRNGNK